MDWKNGWVLICGTGLKKWIELNAEKKTWFLFLDSYKGGWYVAGYRNKLWFKE